MILELFYLQTYVLSIPVPVNSQPSLYLSSCWMGMGYFSPFLFLLGMRHSRYNTLISVPIPVLKSRSINYVDRSKTIPINVGLLVISMTNGCDIQGQSRSNVHFTVFIFYYKTVYFIFNLFSFFKNLYKRQRKNIYFLYFPYKSLKTGK